MSILQISANKNSTQIFEEILNDITYTSESFTVALENDKIFITINDKDNSIIYIDYIAGKVTNFILDFIEPKVIREEVELGCLDLLNEEIEENIAERVEWELLHKDDNLRKDYFNIIKEDISNGFEKHKMFNLSGFLNFRFNSRRLEIKEIINIALEDFFSEESDEQFISLIKRVVSIQQPQLDLMHIVFLENDEYELITGSRERVDMRDVEKIIDEFTYDESNVIEQLHLILSILMTLVPAEIKIHTNEKNDPYISQMIKRIYNDKVTECDSCELCEEMKLLKEEEKDNEK